MRVGWHEMLIVSLSSARLHSIQGLITVSVTTLPTRLIYIVKSQLIMFQLPAIKCIAFQQSA